MFFKTIKCIIFDSTLGQDIKSNYLLNNLLTATCYDIRNVELHKEALNN